MSFVVSARKYRPSRFEDVIGQEHVAITLKNALRNEKLAHAFLFCGPRGVGKTTCARILAKVLNCENAGDQYEPCNVCDNCRAFNENASFNIFELDAASNNTVDHIRSLIDQVRFQPQQGKYKVFIIDEVHMLSSSAFNAFLKTLEEPPPYAIFILATTEKHKIIPTILSRCQIFDFRRIGIPDIVDQLERICKQEGLTAEQDALHVIAQKSDGALRDALSIFDRIASSSDGHITYETVIQNLNILDYDYYFKFTEALLSEDLAEVMLIFDTILKNGFEPDNFVAGLAEHFRNLLVCQDTSTLQLLEVSDSLKERYLLQAALSPASFLLSGLNLAVQCDIHYKMAKNKRLHAEVSLLKMALLQRMIEVSTKKELETAEPVQKKNPELIPPQQESQAQPSPSPKIAPAPSLAPAEHDEPNATPQPFVVSKTPSKKEPTPKTQSAETPKEWNPAILKETPSLRNLDLLTAEIAAEEGDSDKTLKNEVSLEQLQDAWKEYAFSMDSPNLRSVLDNAELSLSGQKIIVVVGSSLARNTLLQESQLMDFLRKSLRHRELVWEIRIDEEKAAKNIKVPKPLTPKEKLLQMTEINPVVKQIFERFDLQMDD